mgnify:CR=1 FL=1
MGWLFLILGAFVGVGACATYLDEHPPAAAIFITVLGLGLLPFILKKGGVLRKIRESSERRRERDIVKQSLLDRVSRLQRGRFVVFMART